MEDNLLEINRKACRTCKEIKPESTAFFYFRKENNKFRTQCIECDKLQKKKQREANKDKINRERREKYKSCEETRLKARDQRLKYTFGINIEEYNKMFEKQNGCCKICNIHQSKMERRFAVDHCHETDIIRGLLCDNCNLGLGNFQDNPEFLEVAKSYLENKGDI
jgi:hypothetical protein